jgi:hypothetical protein
MQTTRKVAVAIGLTAMCAAGLTAQTQETKTTTTTKIEIKGGKDVTVIGCLERGPNGDYMLTDVRKNRRLNVSGYSLVTREDLSKHIGERVKIQGKSVADGNGKVLAESKTKTEVENGKDQETKSTVEATSGTFNMPFLGVKSMKTLSSSCR